MPWGDLRVVLTLEVWIALVRLSVAVKLAEAHELWQGQAEAASAEQGPGRMQRGGARVDRWGSPPAMPRSPVSEAAAVALRASGEHSVRLQGR